MEEKIMRYREYLEEERKKDKRRRMREKKMAFFNQSEKSKMRLEIFNLYKEVFKAHISHFFYFLSLSCSL
jgi:hypothetical protein